MASVLTPRTKTCWTLRAAPLKRLSNKVTVMWLRSHVTSGIAENTRIASENSIISKLPGTGFDRKYRPKTSTTVNAIMKNRTAEITAPKAARRNNARRPPVSASGGMGFLSLTESVAEIDHMPEIFLASDR